MGYNLIRYINDEIVIDFCFQIDSIKDIHPIDEKTLLIEHDIKLPSIKLIQTEFGKKSLVDDGKIGLVAENYFRQECLDSDIIAIKIEQSKESYEIYKKVLNYEYVKRPDYYILKNDVFVEVKAKSHKACKGYFFSHKKDDIEAYKVFQKYANKKMYLAVYSIENFEENRIINKDSLAMIALDSICSENQNVKEKDGFYYVKRKAFSEGLSLLKI